MDSDSLAPIIVFAYARQCHLEKCINSLKKNKYANSSNLTIYCDGSKNNLDKLAVDKVREYVKKIEGFASVTIKERKQNLGLANSIISGVSEILESYEKIIVLEDDLITSPNFLEFMNKALNLYHDVDEVASVHGYIYPIDVQLKNNFFLRGADCWGWGTWRRAWKLFNPSGSELLNSLKRENLLSKFDFDSTYPYSKMLLDQINGINDSWAIRWYASTFLANKLTLYPHKSLIQNIGLDGSGSHGDISPFGMVDLNKEDNIVSLIPTVQSNIAREAFKRFFIKNKNSNNVIKKLFKYLIHSSKP
jgi:hypothetical protein